MNKTSIGATLLWVFAATSAQAVVIDFEGVAAAADFLYVGQNYAEDGFDLFNPGAMEDAVVLSQFLGLNGTGSDYYGWDNPPSNNPVVLTNLSGSNFDLLSVDVGALDFVSPVSFDIIGNLAGGGTLTYNVINAEAFATVDLGWISLSSVHFNFVTGGFPAIDNIDVVVNGVPEPGILALLALGIAGVGFARRKPR